MRIYMNECEAIRAFWRGEQVWVVYGDNADRVGHMRDLSHPMSQQETAREVSYSFRRTVRLFRNDFPATAFYIVTH